MIYVTEFEGKDGKRYGGIMDASSLEQAQANCNEHPRGKNEKVLGVLGATVSLTPDGPQTTLHNSFTASEVPTEDLPAVCRGCSAVMDFEDDHWVCRKCGHTEIDHGDHVDRDDYDGSTQ